MMAASYTHLPEMKLLSQTTKYCHVAAGNHWWHLSDPHVRLHIVTALDSRTFSLMSKGLPMGAAIDQRFAFLHHCKVTQILQIHRAAQFKDLLQWLHARKCYAAFGAISHSVLALIAGSLDITHPSGCIMSFSGHLSCMLARKPLCSASHG